MNRLGLTIWMLIAASGGAAFAQPSGPPQAIEIPGDGDVPLEDRLTSVEVNRDLLLFSGQFDPRSSRALALQGAGRLAEAEALFRLMVAEEIAAADRNDRYLAWSETSLGRVLWQQERDDEAELILRRSYDRIEWRPGLGGLVYWAGTNLGGLLASQGRFSEAEPLLRRAVKDTDRQQFRGSAYSICSQLGLAYVLLAQHKSGELASLLQSIETQVGQFNWGGSNFDSKLQRLRCLASGKCILDATALQAEASQVITSASFQAG